jgi:protein-lysine methyltransferase-like protein
LIALAMQRGAPVEAAELYRAAAARAGALDTEPFRDAWIEHGLRLVLLGAISIHSEPGRYAARLPARPATPRLARRQALDGKRVTNLRHEAVTLDPSVRILLPYLDGTHDEKALAEKYLPHFLSGDLDYIVEGQKITDPDILRERIPADIARILDNLLGAALIEA